MDNQQFETIEMYLEGIKDRLNNIRTLKLEEDLDSIWKKLDEHSQLLKMIHQTLDRIDKRGAL